MQWLTPLRLQVMKKRAKNLKRMNHAHGNIAATFSGVLQGSFFAPSVFADRST
jgi:hypothetical protein